MIKIETDKDKDNTRLEFVGDEETLRTETIIILSSILKKYDREERMMVGTTMLLTALHAAETNLGLKSEMRIDDRLRDFLKGGE